MKLDCVRGGRRSFPIAVLGLMLALTVVAALPVGPADGPVTLVRRAALPRISAERAVEIAQAPAASLNETGTNDFRISDMGAVDGKSVFGAAAPAVAYNATADEYLVVWQGDDDSGSLVDEEFEIFGQRINAATGAEIGSDFRISDMGFVDGNASFDAYYPAVAYNATNNEYLVAWYGDDDSGSLVDGEFEIFGQRINAATGAEIGTNDFRISDMGAVDGNESFGGFHPNIAYNATDNEYLVIWYGDDDTGALVDAETEIYGQRINAATGVEIGSDFRISDMGFTDGDAAFGGLLSAVVHNTTDNEYLVVWYGDDDTGALVSGEFEIRGQRLVGATGAEIGTNDFRISDMGTVDGDHAFDAAQPDVAYNATDNEYLVVWLSDDDTGALVDQEVEIYGQRLVGATGAEIGTNDFRISDMGAVDGNAAFGARHPAVVFNATDNEYLVVWRGDDDTGALVDEEWEIFGQRIDSITGAEIGTNDFRISDMGAVDGSDLFGARAPDVAYDATDNEYLAVWHGDDDSGTLVDDETEIYGQRLAISYLEFFIGALLRSLPRALSG